MVIVIICGFQRDSKLLEILIEVFAKETIPHLGFAPVTLERGREWVQM